MCFLALHDEQCEKRVHHTEKFKLEWNGVALKSECATQRVCYFAELVFHVQSEHKNKISVVFVFTSVWSPKKKEEKKGMISSWCAPESFAISSRSVTNIGSGLWWWIFIMKFIHNPVMRKHEWWSIVVGFKLVYNRLAVVVLFLNDCSQSVSCSSVSCGIKRRLS